MNRQPEHLLDGAEFEYYYQNGSAVAISFYSGKLKYKWIAGVFEGVEEKDLAYDSRKIGEDLYLVNWHDKNNSNFVTLIVNLQQNVLYSSALVYYGTEREIALFDGAIIEHVMRK